MNIVTKSLTALLLIAFTGNVGASPPQYDPRLEAINQTTLSNSIESTSLSSEAHNVLISRANSSGLSRDAYLKYVSLARSNPESFPANLWAGICAKAYWQSFDPVYKVVPVRRTPTQAIHLGESQEAASKYLRKALELGPQSGIAHAEYGYWLFYVESEMKEGIEHLKKGVILAPRSPRAHRLYAEALYNSATPFYDANTAEKELKIAVALDANYASPHSSLGYLYFMLKRYPEARAELAAYEKLVPPTVRQRPSWLRDMLAKVP